ncbi:MAG: MFS transporter [Propionibacteriaceae bacterium]|jgi:MFS family permease|nr:MFS transporter [Propionibacteriaceae bacterium]
MTEPTNGQPTSPEPSPTTTGPVGGWGRFTVAAYGPTTLASVGHGAVTPLVALSALDLGASLEMSALVIGLSAIGQLIGDLPASWIATRLGEKRAIIAACLWDAVFLLLAFSATTLPLLCLAVFCFGPAGAVFGLARQNYLTEAVPSYLRARALSTLGGAYRMGVFLGPLAGAAIIGYWNLAAAYAFAAGMSVLAALVTLALPDLPGERVRGQSRIPAEARLWHVLRTHYRVLLTLGTGTTMLALTRAVRQAILPLWCESIGLSPSATSLIYAVSMAVDMSLFFVGGWIMDRFGRLWVALPSMIVLGIGLMSLAAANRPALVIVVAIVLGLGNGVGSGVIMTLGSDASPSIGRPQFLSGWRLMTDAGNTAGPLAISALVALTTSLAVATVTLGGVACLGAIWLGYGIRHNPPPPRSLGQTSPASPQSPVSPQ